MKIIYNRWIPIKGFRSMNLFGVMFVRSEYKGKLTGTTYVHEDIHTAQMRDFCKWIPVGGLLFYMCYILEFLYRLVANPSNPYRSISFEKEAYAKQSLGRKYLETRKRFAQWRKE